MADDVKPIEIPLTQGYVALVDPVDLDLIDSKWLAKPQKQGPTYACRHTGGKKSRSTVYMHRIILSRVLKRPLAFGEQVDHINGDGLDNRRCNLRLADIQKNSQNRSRRSDNKSGYKGVSWDKKHKSWVSQIKINYKTQRLGFFDTPELAAIAYNNAALTLHGEFAKLNEVAS